MGKGAGLGLAFVFVLRRMAMSAVIVAEWLHLQASAAKNTGHGYFQCC